MEQVWRSGKSSGGKIFFLVHPWFEGEKTALERQKIMLQSQNIEKREGAERYLARFDAYAQGIAASTRKAHEQGLPIVLLLEALPVPGIASWFRTRRRVDEAVTRTKAAFRSQGLEGDGGFFYVLTKSEGTDPLISIELPSRNTVFSRLRAEGTTYAVVGGAYFGGLHFGEVFYRQGDIPDQVAQQVGEERRRAKKLVPHVLEEISVHGCVGGAMLSFADAGIRFRLGRGLTYPQQVPRRSELEHHGYVLRWTKGFA